MKVIIAGGRDFNDYQTLCEICDFTLQNQKDVEIVYGTAKGADTLGKQYAEERGYKIKAFPANWENMSEPCVKKKRPDGEEYNALAGNKRNQEMAEYADALIAFWDTKSTGTKDMITRANKSGLKVKIYNY